MKLITIVSPCYNEKDNVLPLSLAIKDLFEKQIPLSGLKEHYDYRHLFIDNASKDGTRNILREMAKNDSKIQVILNTRNFGHIRSPYHGVLQADADATVLMVSDFQDPPELVIEFLRRWEEGYKVVIGVKNQSNESPLMFAVRKAYYRLVNRLSEIDLVKNYTGFGLYDRRVVDELRNVQDPYPYFRGLIADLGFDAFKVYFTQPTRKRGITKNNFYTLYDIAMLGITNHSKIPLRLATMVGFGLAILSLLVAVGYLIAKLVFWDYFKLGTAPVVIGLFFFSSVQLFFIGILGEYLGAIYTQVQKRPHVVEAERINF